MIPESEWKFFEGTEQRLKHLARHRAENMQALLMGASLPWDPAELDRRQALSLQELDYPARVEAAFALDPTPAEARHLALHRRWALHALFESHPDLAPLRQDLQMRWAALRPQVEGTSATWAEAARLQRESPDREARENAWRALASVTGPLGDDAAELFRRRELLSRALLDTGFPGIAFHFHELDRSEIVGLLDILERFTRRTFEATRREMASVLDVHDLEPWDLDLGFARLGELPAPAIRDPLGALREQAGRWGFDSATFPEVVEAPDLILEAWPVWIEVPRQARVLLRPGHDWDTVRAHFRAFGAALHGLNIGSRRHFLEQDSAVMMEATGRIFEGVLDDPEWLAEHTGADRPAILRHLAAARGRRILNLRRHAALTAFENLAYAASELQPQRLYADVMEHMLQETRRPEAAWTAHPDLVFRPFAHGAALVGAMIAAQTRVALASVPEREWAAWLRAHYLEMGARDSVDVRVERATGSPPALTALAAELGVEAEVPLLGAEEGISEDALAEYFKDIDLSDLD